MKLGAFMDNAEDDVVAFMRCPKDNWPQLASKNPLERLNKDQTTIRVVKTFPNDDARRTPGWRVTRGAIRRMTSHPAT